MRIAVIGSGIAGLTAAHVLHEHHDVHVFEAECRPGGHAHTTMAEVHGVPLAVDTGFLVYNERTYPRFVRLLARLGVSTQASEMSFSVRDEESGVEWRGTSPSTVFAQRRNALRPAFLAMLADVVRFNRMARRLLGSRRPAGTLGELLAGRRWSSHFVDWYLVPMGSAIWSADPATFTEIPARTFAEFFSRHGLLSAGDQPEWRTITGGSRRYVEAALGPLVRRHRVHLSTPVAKIRRSPGQVEVLTTEGPAIFDHVVVATHSDQALELLADPTGAERAVLGAIRYQGNRAVLHTDTTLLPKNRRAWASWNYHRPTRPPRAATVTYYLNRLQGLPVAQPVLVTLNREDAIDPEQVIGRFEYAHPVIDGAAVAAQRQQRSLSSGTVSFCGAYWGYGFHEDGVASALAVCERFGGVL